MDDHARAGPADTPTSRGRPLAFALVHRGVAMALAFTRATAEAMLVEARKRTDEAIAIVPLYP